MKNLREELDETLDVFDAYGISEEKQRYIINEGVYFCFSHGTDRAGIDRSFDCFKFARFLTFCKNMGLDLDANKFLKECSDLKYQDLVHSFDKIDKLSQGQAKSKKR